MYKKYIAFVLLAGFAVAGYFYYDNKSNNVVDDIGEYDSVKQFKYSFNLKNITPREIRGANVWLSMPVAISANQKSLSLKSPEKSKLFRDEKNNQEMYFSYEKINKGETKHVVVDMKMAFSKTGNKYKGALTDQYLASEQYLDLDNSDIQEQAIKFKDPGVQQTTANILSWLKNHSEQASAELAKSNIDSSNVKMDASQKITDVADNTEVEVVNIGSLAVFNKQHLSKSGLLYLYLSFTRGLDIPARGLVGLDVSIKNTLSANDATIWAEYFDGEMWRLVNLDEFVQVDDGSNFVVFNMLDQLPGQAGWEPFSILHKEAAFVVDVSSVKLIAN